MSMVLMSGEFYHCHKIWTVIKLMQCTSMPSKAYLKGLLQVINRLCNPQIPMIRVIAVKSSLFAQFSFILLFRWNQEGKPFMQFILKGTKSLWLFCTIPNQWKPSIMGLHLSLSLCFLMYFIGLLNFFPRREKQASFSECCLITFWPDKDNQRTTLPKTVNRIGNPQHIYVAWILLTLSFCS